MFSIIIPLYNKAEYVSKTLSSVLVQTYPYFEVLVIDDGSTDNSLEVVKAFTDERIHVITQKNKGVSAARNMGINAAQYELIAQLDADDWWDTMYLEEMFALIQKYPSVSMYSSQHANVRNGMVYPSKKILTEGEKTDSFDFIQMCIKLKYPPTTSSNIIFRKSILEVSGIFDERISFYEDYDLLLRMGIYSEMAYDDQKPLSFINQDVNATKRLSSKLPPANKHLIYYLDKFEPYSNNLHLKTAVQNFVLINLVAFRHIKEYKSLKKRLIPQIKLRSFTWEHIIYYYFPIAVTDFMLASRRKLRKYIRGDNG
jgi:glycosyltransferase involved in cell wall biosynthesis